MLLDRLYSFFIVLYKTRMANLTASERVVSLACAHLSNIEEDEEVRHLFEQSDLKPLYDEYITSLLEVERAKKLSDAKKHQLAREMLLDIIEIEA